MSRIAPKPFINEVVRTWSVQPAMTFEVAVDIDGNVWIAESCPVGTHYWTVEQAMQLTAGAHTRRALEEAVTLGCERQSLDHMPRLPVLDGELEAAISGTPMMRDSDGTTARRHLARV